MIEPWNSELLDYDEKGIVKEYYYVRLASERAIKIGENNARMRKKFAQKMSSKTKK